MKEFKPLTKAQKQKADKIIKLIAELSKEDVITIHVSAPDLQLCFVRAAERRHIDFEEMGQLSHQRIWYNPPQFDCAYDSVGF